MVLKIWRVGWTIKPQNPTLICGLRLQGQKIGGAIQDSREMVTDRLYSEYAVYGEIPGIRGGIAPSNACSTLQ
jgi:hypothetical protein